MIDNFSRRILAWRVADTFGPVNSVAVLLAASRDATPSDTAPVVLADAGVENVNAQVDKLIDAGVLRRLLALTELQFSNSMIEAWRTVSLAHHCALLQQVARHSLRFLSGTAVAPVTGMTRTPPYYIVQPWGRDRYRQAGVTSMHATVADADAKLDAIAAKLKRDGAPPDYLELYVVDADRQPVARPRGVVS